MNKFLKFIFISVFTIFVLSSCSDKESFVDICVGNEHSIVLTKNGAVYAIGKNKSGECNVKNWKDIVAIAAGDRHSVGLKKDGSVVACGDNN